MCKVYITGVTGFLGSNIANYLIAQGHEVIATHREASLKKISSPQNASIHWILQDNDWINQVIAHKPDVVIHSAWIGVGHGDRDQWDAQIINIDFLKQILDIAYKSGARQFIGLGSQAEYGVYNGCINEQHPLNPTEAYGRVKVVASELVKQFCMHYNINWYWLRLFSFFGEGESDNWLIPSLIRNIVVNDNMDLTLGEQKYSYLYVKDLGLAIYRIIQNQKNSGVYNISGKTGITLKHLIERIKNAIDPQFKLNFGALPYRSNQSMHMQGNSAKFNETFGQFEITEFDSAMANTIAYFTDKYKA